MRLVVQQQKIVVSKTTGKASIKFANDLTEAVEALSSSDTGLFDSSERHTEHFPVNWDDDYDSVVSKISLMTSIPRDLILVTRSDLVAVGFSYQYTTKSVEFAPCLADHLQTSDTPASANTGRFRTTPHKGILYDNKFISNLRKGKIRVNMRVNEILAVFMQNQDGKPCDLTEIPQLELKLFVFNLNDILMELRGQYDEPMYEGFVSLFWPAVSQSTFRGLLNGSREMGSINDDAFRSHATMIQSYVDVIEKARDSLRDIKVKSSLNNVTLKVKNSIDRSVTVWHLRRIFDLFQLSDTFPCVAYFDGSQRSALLRTRKSFINDHFDKYNKIRDKQVGMVFYGLRVWHLHDDGFGWIYLMPNGEMTIRTSWSYSIINELSNIRRMNKLVNTFREKLLQIDNSRMFNLPRPIILQQTETELTPHLEYFNVQLFIDGLDVSAFRLLLLSLPMHLDLKPSEENHLVFTGEYIRAGLFRKTPKENPSGVKFRLNNNGSIRLGELRSSRQLCVIVDFVKRVAALNRADYTPLIVHNIKKAEQRYPWLSEKTDMAEWDGAYKDMRVRVLQKADPQLFNYHKYITARQKLEYTPYSKLCQGEQQPMVYANLSEVRKFAQGKKHFTHHLEYPNKTDPKRTMYYVCPHRKYPYPGFKDAKLHPKGFCLPCCKKTSSIENKNSANYAKYAACLSGAEKEIEDNFLNPWYVRNYGKRLRAEQLSRLPEDLFYLFNRDSGCNIGSRKIVTPGSDCYLLMGTDGLPKGHDIRYITLDDSGAGKLILRMAPITDKHRYVIVIHNNVGDNVVVHIDPEKTRTTIHEHDSVPIRRLRKVMSHIVRDNERRLAERLRAGQKIEPTLFNVEFVLRKQNKGISQATLAGQTIGLHAGNIYVPVVPDNQVSHLPMGPAKDLDWVSLHRGLTVPEFAFHVEIAYMDNESRYFRVLVSSASGNRRLLIDFNPVTKLAGLAPGYRVMTDLAHDPQPQKLKNVPTIAEVNHKLEMYRDLVEEFAQALNTERKSSWRDKFVKLFRQYENEKRKAEGNKHGEGNKNGEGNKDGDETPGQRFKAHVKDLAQESPNPAEDYWSMKWILSQIARKLKMQTEGMEKWIYQLINGMVLEMDKHSKYELLRHINKKDPSPQDVKQIVTRLCGTQKSPQVISKLVFDLIHNDLRRQEILNDVIPHINETVIGDQDMLEIIPLNKPAPQEKE